MDEPSASFNPNPFTMIKVLHIIDTLTSGGKERQLVEALKFLSRRKDMTCEVVVMSEDLHYDYIEDLDVRLRLLLRKSRKDPSVFFQFCNIIRDAQPDIVHSWSSMCSIYALPAVMANRTRFVNGFIRDAPPHLGIYDQEWRRARLTFPFSDKIVANSHAGLKAFKVSPRKAVCIHNGFDFARLDGLATRESMKRQFDIHADKVIGMVAAFAVRKDYLTFMDAAQRVLRERNDVVFVAVGGGEGVEILKQWIAPEFKERIKLLGRQKRILNIVNLFTIGVLATNTRVHGEGIPNVVMEYMALHKPVIVTDCGGNRELVEDNRSGFLVEPGDPIHMKAKMDLLLDNPTLAESLGQYGYQKLAAEFSLDAMGERLLTLYRSLKP